MTTYVKAMTLTSTFKESVKHMLHTCPPTMSYYFLMEPTDGIGACAFPPPLPPPLLPPPQPL